MILGTGDGQLAKGNAVEWPKSSVARTLWNEETIAAWPTQPALCSSRSGNSAGRPPSVRAPQKEPRSGRMQLASAEQAGPFVKSPNSPTALKPRSEGRYVRLAPCPARGESPDRLRQDPGAPPVLDDGTTRILAFGAQVDSRLVVAHRRTDDPDRGLDPQQVAGYLTKYSTKSATESAGDENTNAHLERLRAVADAITDWATQDATLADDDESAEVEHPYERMTNWVHMLGFRGHFSTKSRRYSVTLGALRRAQRRAQILIANSRATGERIDLAELEAELMADEDEETTLVLGQWRFAGTGWETPGDAAMANAAAARAREYAQWKAQHPRH